MFKALAAAASILYVLFALVVIVLLMTHQEVRIIELQRNVLEVLKKQQDDSSVSRPAAPIDESSN